MLARLCCWFGISIVLLAFTLPMARSVGAAEADGNAAAAQDAQGGGQADATPTTESGIHWFLRCSGLIGLFIFGLSVYFVALVIRLFMSMKTEVEVPLELVTGFQELAGQGNLQGAYEMAKASDSFLGRVVARGIEHLPNGLTEGRHAMDRTAEAETVRMEKQISMMAVLGTLGPMIGLIGTLKGMIASFSVIAMSGVMLKANEVASGISEALLLTFEGVGLSVPAIYFFAFFRNRVATITAEAMLEADDLLHLFFRTGGRARGGAATAAQATPQAGHQPK